MPGNSQPARFTAKVALSGINPYVEVPEDIRGALGPAGLLPVRGTVAGYPFRSTLVPVKGKPSRLFLNLEMRRGAGVGVGDTVEIFLEVDPDERIEPVPDLLRQALDRDFAIRSAWETLTPSRRKEILRYLNSLKSPAALERNVGKVVRRLREPS